MSILANFSSGFYDVSQLMNYVAKRLCVDRGCERICMLSSAFIHEGDQDF